MGKRLPYVFLLICLLLPLITVIAGAEGERENLVNGLSYAIDTGEPVSFSHANFKNDNGTLFEQDNGQLTNGLRADISESNREWYMAFRGKSRIITFDLGQKMAVEVVSASFLHKKTSGIYAPRYINISLSENGNDYRRVKEYSTEYPMHSAEVQIYQADIPLDRIYATRYVRVEFSSDIFCFCDEISVFGSRELSGKERAIRPDKEESAKGYLTDLNGLSDIVKLYNGYYEQSTVGYLTEQQLLPYVAYLDTNKNIAGTMFDAVTLVPCHGDYPSGGRLVKTNGKKGAVMSDWELYFENTFAEGYNLSALNSVVERVYSALDKEGKYSVFLTIPYPTVIDTPFGDINGDGRDEMCVTLKERTEIIKWYVNKCISAFKEKKYSHLKLEGFYWYREEVNYSDSDHEPDLVKQMNRYVKGKGYATYMDAFYLSTGYDHWEELGFSGAVMQPNVAFDKYSYFQIPMLSEFAYTAYYNHLGASIETAEPSKFASSDYIKAGINYESYLYYGYKQGYMHCLNTYYQGAGPGNYYNFCYADISTNQGRYLRRLYDLTYAFVKGTYKNSAPQLTVSDIRLVHGDKSGMAEIEITDSDSYWDDIKVEFVTKPVNGRAGISADKQSLVYTPDSEFIGEDSFVIRVFDGFNYSEEITVKASVIKNEEEFSFAIDNTSEGTSSFDSNEKGSNKGNLILVLIIIILALPAVISLAVLLLRKKNNK